MRVLVVFAHPSATSFAAAVRDRAVAALARTGHEVDLIDLYAEGFDPRARLDEVEPRAPDWVPEPTLAEHGARVRAAEALVLVHPTWWGSQPAILKGWFDRVIGDGLVHASPGEGGRPRRALGHVRHLVVLTTYGSSRWVNWLQGEPGRRVARWSLRRRLHPLARTRWLACYRMDADDDDARRRFLDRVDVELARLGDGRWSVLPTRWPVGRAAGR